MNHRQRLKAILRSRFFYVGALMLVAGLLVCSISYDTQILGAFIAQAGFIICIWTYAKVRVIDDPSDAARQRQRSRMALVVVGAMVCVGFMLTPVVLLPIMSTMHGFLFWYIVATGLVGLSGLVGLIVWLKRSSH